MGGGGGYVSTSPAEKKNAALAEQMWSDYKKRYLPVEKQYAKQVTKINYRRGTQVGMAGAGAIQNSSQLTERGRKSQFGIGVNPNSGASAEMNKGAPTSAATTGAETTQNMKVTGQGVKHMGSAVMIGQGVRGAAVNGYDTMASLGNSEAISNQEYNNASHRAVLNAVGTAVGTYYSMKGNNKSPNLGDHSGQQIGTGNYSYWTPDTQSYGYGVGGGSTNSPY